jgi:hypothetical protein
MYRARTASVLPAFLAGRLNFLKGEFTGSLSKLEDTRQRSVNFCLPAIHLGYDPRDGTAVAGDNQRFGVRSKSLATDCGPFSGPPSVITFRWTFAPKKPISGKTDAAEHTPWAKNQASLNCLFSECFRNEKVGGAGPDRTDPRVLRFAFAALCKKSESATK